MNKFEFYFHSTQKTENRRIRHGAHYNQFFILFLSHPKWKRHITTYRNKTHKTHNKHNNHLISLNNSLLYVTEICTLCVGEPCRHLWLVYLCNVFFSELFALYNKSRLPNCNWRNVLLLRCSNQSKIYSFNGVFFCFCFWIHK